MKILLFAFCLCLWPAWVFAFGYLAWRAEQSKAWYEMPATLMLIIGGTVVAIGSLILGLSILGLMK